MTTSSATTIVLPPLYAAQRDAIFAPERFSVIEASTKSGKTFGCMVWIIDQASRARASSNFWWVAPTLSVAKIAYRRMCEMWRKADPKQHRWSDNASECWIRMPSGARIWFKGSDNPDSLYGEDVYGAVVDEASRAKEEAWHALRSTLTATKAPVRIIGNVKGRKNWAYRLARLAESGEPDFHHAKLTAYDAVQGGIFDEAEIESARRSLPEHIWRELYLAEPSDDEGNPFGIKAIRECVGDCSDAGPPAVWGIDLAKSVDWTVAIALDEQRKVRAFQRWQGDWRGTTARLCAMVGYADALADSTGVGDAIVPSLQEKCGSLEGYKFTQQSKQQLMEGLAAAIQRRDITIPEGLIVSELETFEYEYRPSGVRYSAPDGLHDDCVCALALAVECHRRRGPGLVRIYGVSAEEEPQGVTMDGDDGWTAS